MNVNKTFNHSPSGNTGQAISEYAVLLAMILVLVLATLSLIGSNSNHVLSEAASSIS